MTRRRVVVTAMFMISTAIIGWIYFRSLVPAVHEDHDHGLESLAGGGFLRVEGVEGGERNLVGRPGRVLILHWFELGSSSGVAELPSLVDYANSVASDPGIEVVLIASRRPREEILAWARDHGVPTGNLFVDPGGKTAALIGVRNIPETLFYDAEGHLMHQARGHTDWSSAETRAAIEGYKEGGGGHAH